MADDVVHLPPAWASSKDWRHPAWPSFINYMKEDGEVPTPKLWTLWHAAFLRGETTEWQKRFKEAEEKRSRIFAEKSRDEEAARG